MELELGHNLWLEYKLDMEALCISRLTKDHLIYCCTYPDQRENQPPFAPPPLPVFDQLKNTRGNPRNKFTTCITRVSRQMLDHTECMEPHPEMPWRLTELDIPNNIQVFIPVSNPGESKKEEWTNNHIEFTIKIEAQNT